jgi:hypothetical protein
MFPLNKEGISGSDLPHVTSLDLSLNPIGDLGLAAMIGALAEALPQLRQLDLGNCGLSGKGVLQ